MDQTWLTGCHPDGIPDTVNPILKELHAPVEAQKHWYCGVLCYTVGNDQKLVPGLFVSQVRHLTWEQTQSLNNAPAAENDIVCSHSPTATQCFQNERKRSIYAILLIGHMVLLPPRWASLETHLCTSSAYGFGFARLQIASITFRFIIIELAAVYSL